MMMQDVEMPHSLSSGSCKSLTDKSERLDDAAEARASHSTVARMGHSRSWTDGMRIAT